MTKGICGDCHPRAIRSSDINRRTPIVVITAEESLETMRAAQSAGATFVLTKPVDQKALLKLFDTTQGIMWAAREKK